MIHVLYQTVSTTFHQEQVYINMCSQLQPCFAKTFHAV